MEIRELIIRCLSQMILARVTNVKSGWKSMFMVFTTAANDRDPMIVRCVDALLIREICYKGCLHTTGVPFGSEGLARRVA